MASTLALELQDWDLCVDTSGNIALATEPYAIAQDVASACKTFLGECWYDTTYGIPAVAMIAVPVPVQLADNAGNLLFDNAGNPLYS